MRAGGMKPCLAPGQQAEQAADEGGVLCPLISAGLKAGRKVTVVKKKQVCRRPSLTRAELGEVLEAALGVTIPDKTIESWSTRGIIVVVDRDDQRRNLYARDDLVVALCLLKLQGLTGFQSALPLTVARELRRVIVDRGGVLPLVAGTRAAGPIGVEVGGVTLTITQDELDRLADALDRCLR